jgi:hypothetical protein
VKRLLLPPLSQLKEYLHAKVGPFFEDIRRVPDNTASLNVNEQYDSDTVVRFSIVYDPRATSFTGTHPSYTSVYDIDRHVLWRRLTEKRQQFADATEETPRVLFVCDGGCAVFRHPIGGGVDYRIEEVLDHFWRRPSFSKDCGWSWGTEEDISAVVALSIEATRTSSSPSAQRSFHLDCRPYCNPHARFPLDEAHARLIDNVVSKLPVPIENAGVALSQVSTDPFSTRRLEGFTMTSNRVEMSGVELLRLLSGELSIEEFCRNYQLSSNPFSAALKGSRTIKAVRVEPVADRDDDKIIIEFRPRDVAKGPFVVPQDEKR